MGITNGYCSLADLKTVLRIADTVDDGQFEARINEASRVIDDYCGRRFYADSTATARVYRAGSPATTFVDDISSTTGLVVQTDSAGDGSWATTVASADYVLEPANCLAMGRPAGAIVLVGAVEFPTGIRPGVRVTAKWGWPTVPLPVRSACVLLAGRLVKRGDSLLGVAGFGDLGALPVRPIDPDVQRMLAPYRLPVVA